ncbi:MAG: thiaminase II [Alphaproteobacteria bacterium]|jgi:thiaminase/transcriptional activator TenA|nr:thiaminase II [Alphaproteobacteria bacterium]MDP6253783.1 thiaminase II [Alphaproteobacteria bacterium]MDP7055779.1 thiaminase II [Alphaproteobacteria bacterium]MDP7230476.1 thiaminase II [Alphaproteobacteria bacterium]MDP7460547.1 thiaminase II [Alphaproteobacteria bacterium]|tara:strand:- start:8904 stop:9575 length:672 start_codon:yes stop_codon:yes gene_type:complete
MPKNLFERLKGACPNDWRAYTGHNFVRQLAAGSLAEASFRHYLGQDYLFLIHFARAYALAAYKATSLSEMRGAVASVDGILNTEMALHVEYCRGWGLDEAAMTALPEANATMAYTRFVLECGMAGDSLDLYAALAPCVIGYGEIGTTLAADPGTVMAGNPYASWIEMYASDDYQGVAQGALAQLDSLGEQRLTSARFEALARTFRQATRLEADFWQMGLTLAP